MHFLYVFLCWGGSSPLTTCFGSVVSRGREAPGLGLAEGSLPSELSLGISAFATTDGTLLTPRTAGAAPAHEPQWSLCKSDVFVTTHGKLERLKLKSLQDSSIASLLTAKTLNTQLPQVWKLAHFLSVSLIFILHWFMYALDPEEQKKMLR